MDWNDNEELSNAVKKAAEKAVRRVLVDIGNHGASIFLHTKASKAGAVKLQIEPWALEGEYGGIPKIGTLDEMVENLIDVTWDTLRSSAIAPDPDEDPTPVFRAYAELFERLAAMMREQEKIAAVEGE